MISNASSLPTAQRSSAHEWWCSDESLLCRYHRLISNDSSLFPTGRQQLLSLAQLFHPACREEINGCSWIDLLSFCMKEGICLMSDESSSFSQVLGVTSRQATAHGYPCLYEIGCGAFSASQTALRERFQCIWVWCWLFS
jgi:hypothetical protein